MERKTREKIKTSDLHIRLSDKNHKTLKTISSLTNKSITNIIEEYITKLEEKHNL
jgi:ribosomal protein S17E